MRRKIFFVLAAALLLCCSAALSFAAPFIDNGSTVTDTRTGLIWQKQDDGNARTWDGALSYCEGLPLAGQIDWRLPNIKELESITDDSRYNPAIDPVFTGTKSSYYWSSTTAAGYPSNACYVYFNDGYVAYSNKDVTLYVRCVRAGQSGSFGNLGYFEFSSIPTPRSVGVPFSVTITAKDVNGNPENYNGYVSLYSNAGSVNPVTVWLTSGTWTGGVTLYEGGTGIYLGASAGGKYGTSNTFDVTGGASTGNLHGTVKDTDKHMINGAAVNLYRISPKDGGVPVNSTTATNGYYSFNNISCGEYYVRAEDNGSYSQVNEVTVACGRTEAENLIISYCNADGRLPILLVPGIAGSNSKYIQSIYPILPKDAPKWDSGKLVLHDPFWQAGWRNLKDELKTHGYKEDCTMFDVPYDWRLDLNDAWVKYLKPWIDKAKTKAGTTEVNIVAHSMGGLLTRAYIQSDIYPGRDDINRFAMVGTPNHGAATAYYMWEGGDPKLADDLNEPYYMEFLNFYTNTFNAMHLVYKKYPLCVKWPVIGGKCDNKEAYDMAHLHVPSLKWLMPTFNNVLSKGDITEEENSFLKNLNGDSDRNRMTNDGTGVRTKIFAGNGEKTIRTIYNGNPPQSGDLYPDGAPLGTPYGPSIGDGTVLKDESAAVDFLNSPASTNGSHAGLINTFLGDIIVFITGDEPFAPLSPPQFPYAKVQALTNVFSLGIDGRVQPYLVSPTGEGSGINPTTGDMENDIPDTDVSIGIEAGSISINNPADGTYTVYLKGIYSEDYRLNLGYMDNAETENYSYHGFNHAETISFAITVNSASADKVTVNHTLLPPTGLQADAVDDGGLKTTLTWTASSDPAVTGYNIYAKYEDEPYLTQIGSSATNSFNTGDEWAENSSILTSIYAVSAVKADSTESFLSNMVENNDRDHDGLTDGQETSMGTNISNPDTDGDGLKDGEEYTRGTSPLLADTDGDGYSDYDEIQAGTDPLDPASPSKQRILVTWYYNSILNRAPEPGGAEGWTTEIERIDTLGIDIKEGFIALGKLFFNSGEYLNMNTSNNAYVTDLYETFLGRTPSQSEVDGWAGELSGGLTRNLLLNYFIFSTEFKQYMDGIFGDTTVRPEYNLVNDLYRGFLSRLPDDAGFNSWLAQMQTAQCNGNAQAIRDLTSQIALNFLQSQEYADRNTSNSIYIEDLYNGILRRGAELAGYQSWLALLNNGTYTRQTLLAEFVNSPEFQTRVTEVINAGCAP